MRKTHTPDKGSDPSVRSHRRSSSGLKRVSWAKVASDDSRLRFHASNKLPEESCSIRIREFQSRFLAFDIILMRLPDLPLERLAFA